MKRFTKHLLACAVAAGLAAPVAAFATNGYFAPGYSIKSDGMVGTGVALPQDAMAAATNPAGMVWVGNRMDIGAAIFSPHRSYTVTNPGPGGFLSTGKVDSGKNYFLIPSFGRNWMLDANSAVGLSIYGNGGMNTEYPNIANKTNACGGSGATGTFCGGKAAGIDLMQLFVNGTYSRKIDATSSWGVSLIGVYQRFKATGLVAFETNSSSPNNMTGNGYSSSTGLGVKIGWQGQVTPTMTLGASYQTKMSMSKFDKYKGLFAEQGGFDIPATATVGLAFKTAPTSTLAFDIQKIYYSGVEAIADSSSVPKQFGSNGGPGFGWQDMTVYKLGYQWQGSQGWTWRAGYSYGKQPIPSSDVMLNILAPGVMQSHLSFGFTKQMGPKQAFNFAAVYAPSTSVSGKDAAAYGSQNIKIQMVQYQVEGSWSWKF